MTDWIDYRDIDGWPGYQIGSDGTLWSCRKNTKQAAEADGWHLVTGGVDRDGYRKAILCVEGIRRHVRIHVLVIEAFVGGPPESMQNPTVAHLNGIRDDNRLSNLEWKTQKDNIADKLIHGTAQVGESHGQSKLTNADVIQIRQLRQQGLIWKTIAEQMGMPLSTVYAVGSGRQWKHLV